MLRLNISSLHFFFNITKHSLIINYESSSSIKVLIIIIKTNSQKRYNISLLEKIIFFLPNICYRKKLIEKEKK
jgi:hypothetical protein